MKKSNVLNGETDSTTVKTELDKTIDLLDCLDLSEYYKLPTIEEKVNWLKTEGEKVCKGTLKEAILKSHEVVDNLSHLRGTYVTTWGELKPIIGSYKYEYYLNIVNDEKTISGVTRVENYIPDDDGLHYRFSGALINILADEYTKDENSQFQFSFANLDKKTIIPLKSEQAVVVIQVVGNPDDKNPVIEAPYYDYSTDPKFISTDNIPL